MNEDNHSTSIIAGIVIVLIIIGGGWWLMSHSGSQSDEYGTSPSQATQTQQNASSTDYTPATTQGSAPAPSTPSTPSAPMSATVYYTAQGFSPANVTIAQGGTVTWVDQTQNPMWVASGQHPIHTGYDGTTEQQHCAPGYAGPTPFDECTAGTGSYTFTFGKVGSWPYHNHLDAAAHGTITVLAQ